MVSSAPRCRKGLSGKKRWSGENALLQSDWPAFDERERKGVWVSTPCLASPGKKAEGLKTFSFTFNSLSLFFLVSCPQNRWNRFGKAVLRGQACVIQERRSHSFFPPGIFVQRHKKERKKETSCLKKVLLGCPRRRRKKKRLQFSKYS